MGRSRLSTVRKAARLAVYEEMMIRANKNHHPAANLSMSMMMMMKMAMMLMEVYEEMMNHHPAANLTIIIII